MRWRYSCSRATFTAACSTRSGRAMEIVRSTRRLPSFASSRISRSAISARRVTLDPRFECLQELLQKFAGRVVLQRAVLVEQLGGAADVRLRLLHRRDVEEYERLPQRVVRAEAANRS